MKHRSGLSSSIAITGRLMLTATVAFAQDDRPNIIYIMSDDQGYGNFGFNGN